jgi:transcriptional regulator with XRE-family HTH domain
LAEGNGSDRRRALYRKIKNEITGKDIARAINILLEKNKMSQADLTRAAKYERSYVSKIAAGGVKFPRLDTMQRISRVFGMDVDEFLAFTKKIKEEKKKFKSEKKIWDNLMLRE